jgi:galactonate dehydratase
LKIETDSGISGWGEPLVEGCADTLFAAVKEWENYLVGKDPLLIEDIWQTMYRCSFYRGGPVLMSCIAGINEALWDIKGKYFDTPVYQLLGGPVKTRIMVYRGIFGQKPEEYAADAKKALEQDYKLMKIYPVPNMHYVDSISKIDEVLAIVDAIHSVIKGKAQLAIDFHGRVHKPMAKAMVKELNAYPLQFIEEPVMPTNKEALRDVVLHTSCPIAIGERMYSRWDFKNLFEDGYADIIQPDVSHAGGISETRRIATMAEAYDLAVAPHCPLSVISFASCIQLDAATPNVVFQEQCIDVHQGNKENPFFQVLKNPEVFRYEDGYVLPPTGPGLGIEIDEGIVIEIQRNHEFRNKIWRTYDGTPIEQ